MRSTILDMSLTCYQIIVDLLPCEVRLHVFPRICPMRTILHIIVSRKSTFIQNKTTEMGRKRTRPTCPKRKGAASPYSAVSCQQEHKAAMIPIDSLLLIFPSRPRCQSPKLKIPLSPMTTLNPPYEYQGSCQCGIVTFKASLPKPITTPPYRITNCPCSICTRNGILNLYIPRSDITWLSGWDKLKNFRFNTKSVDHKFCPECGSSVVIDPLCFYQKMEGFEDAPDVLGLNVRMFEGVDVKGLELTGEGVFVTLRDMMAERSEERIICGVWGAIEVGRSGGIRP
ncbi:gb [Venturia nashicola]|uniref:Gb n=1 Tax=Venturia nashicola TaxID=86259 RepID=A0A4Z1PE12_9PEZI|nr:gb [Venturia nashicola]